MKNYKLELKLSITEINKDSWNNMNHSKNPFYQWQWLANLELSKSVERLTGWQPLYFVVSDENQICGIAPLFLKNHSYGEFIFDQSFARLGLKILSKTYWNESL